MMQDDQHDGGGNEGDALEGSVKWENVAGGVQAYATPRPIGRPSDVFVGLAHVSAVLLSVQVEEAADEVAADGILRTRAAVGVSCAKTFRCTKPTISDRSGTRGRLRCPTWAPKIGMTLCRLLLHG